MNDADEVLQSFDILQILLRLAELGLQLLVENLFQVLEDALLGLTQVANGPRRTINLIILLIITTFLYVIFISDRKLPFNLLNSNQNLIEILLDETCRFLNSVDLLQTLRLQIVTGNYSRLHHIN